MEPASLYLSYCTLGSLCDDFKSCLQFLNNVDWDDECDNLDFSVLHKIV